MWYCIYIILTGKTKRMSRKGAKGLTFPVCTKLSRHVQAWKCVCVPEFDGSQPPTVLLVQEKLEFLQPQQQVALLRQMGSFCTSFKFLNVGCFSLMAVRLLQFLFCIMALAKTG